MASPSPPGGTCVTELHDKPLIVVSWFPGCADDETLAFLAGEDCVDGIETRYLDDQARAIAGCDVPAPTPTPSMTMGVPPAGRM